MTHIGFTKNFLFRLVVFLVLGAFVGLLPERPSYAQVSIFMPPAGQMVRATSHFDPPQMIGLKIDLKDPFSFNFIMDQGEVSMSDAVKKEEFNKIIKYFLVSLAMPNRDMWVNLSPYESKRIIPEIFAQTEMGRDLLAQDYTLKQFTASLMYPEEGVGKIFWSKVYKEAKARFGTTDISVNTFNKVWIVADKADIYQKGDSAFLVNSHLKVMLEQDYMAIEKNKEQFGNFQTTPVNDEKSKMASKVVREIIIPVIEKEVNEGKSFATVRQVYNAEIMATWFKKTLKQSLLGQVFADKSRIAGQKVSDPQSKEKIYKQYLKAYKKGVFNYIKEDATPDGETMPRKYFSGGAEPVDAAMLNEHPDSAMVTGFGNRIVKTMERINLVTASLLVRSDLGKDFFARRGIEYLKAGLYDGFGVVGDGVRLVGDKGVQRLEVAPGGRGYIIFGSTRLDYNQQLGEWALTTKTNDRVVENAVGRIIKTSEGVFIDGVKFEEPHPETLNFSAFPDEIHGLIAPLKGDYTIWQKALANARLRLVFMGKLTAEIKDLLDKIEAMQKDIQDGKAVNLHLMSQLQGEAESMQHQVDQGRNEIKNTINLEREANHYYHQLVSVQNKIGPNGVIERSLASLQSEFHEFKDIFMNPAAHAAQVSAAHSVLALQAAASEAARRHQRDAQDMHQKFVTNFATLKDVKKAAEGLKRDVLAASRDAVTQARARLYEGNYLPSRTDKAMIAEQPLGGINLSDENLIINIKVDGAGIPLSAQFQDRAMMSLNGLISVIRTIIPVTPENVPVLYELATPASSLIS